MFVTILLCVFVGDQMRHNLESAQYLWESYYKIIITNKYILLFLYIFKCMDVYLQPKVYCDLTQNKILILHHHDHHHHHVVPQARISLTLFRHFSLSFVASGRSSEPHPVSSHSCWMYVRAGRPAFARP